MSVFEIICGIKKHVVGGIRKLVALVLLTLQNIAKLVSKIVHWITHNYLFDGIIFAAELIIFVRKFPSS